MFLFLFLFLSFVLAYVIHPIISTVKRGVLIILLKKYKQRRTLCTENSFLSGPRPIRLHVNAPKHLADTAAGINIIINHTRFRNEVFSLTSYL